MCIIYFFIIIQETDRNNYNDKNINSKKNWVRIILTKNKNSTKHDISPLGAKGQTFLLSK